MEFIHQQRRRHRSLRGRAPIRPALPSLDHPPRRHRPPAVDQLSPRRLRSRHLGNGQTAIAATNGRLVSIDIATGAVRELIPTTPICYPGIQMSGYGRLSLAPGSLFSIRGTALAASTQAASAPLPTELAGTQVLMNGTPLPLLSVSPTEVWFQVPFEAPPGTIATLTIDYGSPFGGCSVVLPISGRGPAFFWDNGGNVISIHQGFTGLVTRQSHCCLEVGFS